MRFTTQNTPDPEQGVWIIWDGKVISSLYTDTSNIPQCVSYNDLNTLSVFNSESTAKRAFGQTIGTISKQMKKNDRQRRTLVIQQHLIQNRIPLTNGVERSNLREEVVLVTKQIIDLKASCRSAKIKIMQNRASTKERIIINTLKKYLGVDDWHNFWKEVNEEIEYSVPLKIRQACRICWNECEPTILKSPKKTIALCEKCFKEKSKSLINGHGYEIQH